MILPVGICILASSHPRHRRHGPGRLGRRHRLGASQTFNALNIVNLPNPLTNLGPPQTLGVAQSARPVRIIQLGLKYAF